jgi:hypothetical protein
MYSGKIRAISENVIAAIFVGLEFAWMQTQFYSHLKSIVSFLFILLQPKYAKIRLPMT